MKNLLQCLVMAAKRLFPGALLLLLTGASLMASPLEAQVKSINEGIISLDKKSYSLSQFFRKTEKKTEFKFFYTDKVLRNEKVDFASNRGNVEEFLIEIAKQTDLRFKQVNNTISVIAASKKATEDLIEVTIQEQDVAVQGMVSDDTEIGRASCRERV